MIDIKSILDNALTDNDIKNWKDIFNEAVKDKDFAIIAHPTVEVKKSAHKRGKHSTKKRIVRRGKFSKK